MKNITKDIQLTLAVKFVLLIALWVLCFKGAEKNTVGLAQWLYGANTEATTKSVEPVATGNTVFDAHFNAISKDYA